MVEIEAKLANLQSNSGDSKKDEILLRGFSFQVFYYLSPSLCVVPYYFSFVVIFPPHKLLFLQLYARTCAQSTVDNLLCPSH